mmetsp:Transcript_8102/g.19857  ORF Transcript_8102/g.19857 Transcript_8102/m.19857 type:complete len:1310 (+) Transcript_8102:99-4028(+)
MMAEELKRFKLRKTKKKPAKKTQLVITTPTTGTAAIREIPLSPSPSKPSSSPASAFSFAPKEVEKGNMKKEDAKEEAKAKKEEAKETKNGGGKPTTSNAPFEIKVDEVSPKTTSPASVGLGDIGNQVVSARKSLRKLSRSSRAFKMSVSEDEKLTDEYQEQKTEKGKINFLAKLQRRTKNRKKAKYISKNRSVIDQMIKDMSSRPKFGKMISYSLTCLTNLCVNEVSCEEMIDSGIFTTLNKITKMNPYNENLRRLINGFVTKMAINDDMRKLVGDKLEGSYLISSLDHHLETQTLVSTCRTIAHVATPKFAQKFMRHNGTRALAKVIARNNLEQGECIPAAREGKVLAASAVVANTLLNRCAAANKSRHLCDKFLENHVVRGLLEGMSLHLSNETLIRNGGEIIASMSKANTKWAQALKRLGAVEVLVKCLEENPYNVELLRIGADALTQLGTTAELDKALKMLRKLDPNAMATIGVLALVGENVEYLIANGGVPLITTVMREMLDSRFDLSPQQKRFLVNGLRSLERMANDQRHAFEVIKNQGVQILLNCLSKHGKDAEIVPAALAGLSALASRKENCDYMLKMGVLKAVVAMAMEHEGDRLIAVKVMDVLTNLCKTKALAKQVLDEPSGALARVLFLMKIHGKDREVILKAVLLLKKAIEQLGSEEAIRRIIAAGGLPLVIQALDDMIGEKEVLKPTLELVGAFAEDRKAVAVLKQHNAIRCLFAIMKAHKKDKHLTLLAAKVAGRLVSEKDISRYLKDMKELNERIAMMDLTALPELVPLSKLMAGLADVEENRQFLIKHHAVQTIGGAVKAIKILPTTPETTQVLHSLCLALSALSLEKEGSELIIKEGLHKIILEIAMQRKADEKLAEICSEIFRDLALNAPNAFGLEEDGSVELITRLAQLHDENDIIVGNIQSIVLNLNAKKDDREKDINKMIELTLTSLENSEDVNKLRDSLQYLLKLSESSEAALAMITQEAYKTVLSAAQDHSSNPEIVGAAIDMLSRLADEEPDLLVGYAEADFIQTSAKTMRKLFNVPEIVRKEVFLLEKIALKRDAIGYFLKTGPATARLLAWVAKGYSGKDKLLTQSSLSILKRIAAHAEKEAQAEALRLEREEKLLKEAEAKARELQGRHITQEEMDYILQNINLENPDSEMLGDLIGLIGLRDNLEFFIDGGGLDMVSDILLDPNVTDDAFNSAVLCFDAGLADLDSSTRLNLRADRKALDALVQIFAPGRVERYNFPVDKLKNSLSALLDVTGDKKILLASLKTADLGDALLKITGEGSDPALLIPTMRMLARITNLKEQG